MKNTHLWRALGRNFIISIVLFGALLGLLWLAEMIFFEPVTLIEMARPRLGSRYSGFHHRRCLYTDGSRPAELHGFLCRYRDVGVVRCTVYAAEELRQYLSLFLCVHSVPDDEYLQMEPQER